MTSLPDLTSALADHPAPFTDQMRLAVAAYLARFTGPSRQHIESDLRCYLSWSAGRDVDLRDVQIAARHADPRTIMRYDNSRKLHQPGEKPQVSSSRPSRNSVPRLRTAAV